MKTALIWGAAGGIGRALTRGLGERGWPVFAVARTTEALGDLTPHRFEADLADPASVQRAVIAMSRETDPVALAICAAGDIGAARVADMRPETWSRILGATLTGAFLTTHAGLPLLAPDAHLVFVGAVAERLRLPGLSAYAAAKSGLEAFVATLAKEEPARRVTLVRPGAVATSFWEKVPFKRPPSAVTPEALAARVLDAHEAGHRGVLDVA
jgi:3-oxoacyl-[acyl-carrier protein] reductase